MSNKIQIKRTSVTGRTPNTTTSANGSYIDTGELALNITDGKMFSSNGSVFFEAISKIIANGAFGTNSQILFSSGSSMYWGDNLATGIFPLGDYGTLGANNIDAFGVSLDTTYDAHAPGAFTILDLQSDLAVEDGGNF
jgi:hypothetical protein